MERAWWLLGSEGSWAGWGREPVGAPQGQQMGAAAPARKKPTIWPPGALDLQRRSGRARRSWGSVNRCFWLQEEKGTPGQEGRKNSSQLGRTAVFEELSQKEPRNLPHSPLLPLPGAGQHLWGRRGSAEVQGVFLLVPNLALTFLLSFYVAVLWQGEESSSQGGMGARGWTISQLSRLGLRGGTGKEVVPLHPFPLKPLHPTIPLHPSLGLARVRKAHRAALAGPRRDLKASCMSSHSSLPLEGRGCIG